MKSDKFIRTLALAIVLVGGAYLSASPAQAAPVRFECSVAQWEMAITAAEHACGGPASVAGTCIGNTLFVKEIYCLG